MIVEEIEMPPRQPRNLAERVVYLLRVERFAPFEEGLFIAEVADVRASARYHNRVGDEIVAALDQVTPDVWNALKCADGRGIDRRWVARPVVRQEGRPCIFAGAEKDAIRMVGGFLRQ